MTANVRKGNDYVVITELTEYLIYARKTYESAQYYNVAKRIIPYWKPAVTVGSKLHTGTEIQKCSLAFWNKNMIKKSVLKIN